MSPSADEIAAALERAGAGKARVISQSSNPYDQRAYVYNEYFKKGRPIPEGMDIGKGPLFRDSDNPSIERPRENQAPAIGAFVYFLQALAEEGARPSDIAAADHVKTLRRVLSRLHAARRRYYLNCLWLPFREDAKSEWRRAFGLVDEAVMDWTNYRIIKRFETGAEIVIDVPERPLLFWGYALATLVVAGFLCAWLAPVFFDQLMTVVLVGGLGFLVLWAVAVSGSNSGDGK
jgi:hypothetical protein